MNLPSPIQSVTFENKQFFIKRDDLIHPDFSGNKARKFYYFLKNDLSGIEKVISYGSSQSNAMYSLSVLAKMKGWKFEYYVDHIAEYLRENSHGNYKAALENDMQMIVGRGVPTPTIETIYIEEGGRQKEAEFGIKILAQEIIDWQEENGIGQLNVFLPSGTGTTALFLQKSLITHHSSLITRVYTTACVGDTTYLKKQFLELEANEKYHPQILTLDKKHHFGKLYKENYKIWLKLHQQTGVEFDLLYDPLGWRVLMAHPEVHSKPTLYIHQGGLLGNESMLPRYKRKYPFP
ncbi:1-aminocyclopropane-1-carboxylate deaminase [Sulfurovum riftiae]|uniref:1-aminocyclopropane-1-carboxylate deaminase n=1 Tax=Sulfurovum riftiae TaxID=1630136 RepID=A0A151CJR6_9BACT|nr:1-aminocyclopropane-1-carboxylate deaminase [Sulfurovum riftiae]